MKDFIAVIAKITLLLIFSLSSLLKSQNQYPVVFVHGFMGWGPDEMGPYNYWGGKYEMIKEFEKNGH